MEFNLNERSDVEETASFSLQADFEPVIDRKRGSIEEKALRVSQQTQSLRQNKIWSKSKIRISSTPGLLPPLVPQFRYSNFQIQLSKRSPEERSYTTLTTFETQRKRAPSGRDLQLSKVWLVYLVLRRWDLVPRTNLLWDWMSIPFWSLPILPYRWWGFFFQGIPYVPGNPG